MRILHLIPNLSGGGAERQFSYLAPELVFMGHRVDVTFLNYGPAKPELFGVRMHQLIARNNYDPCLLWQLIQLIRHIKPDIIHTWILQMDILGGIAARINSVPWILREQSSASAHPPNWKNRLRVWVGSYASAIVSNSQGGDRYWKTQLPYSLRYVLQNGLPVCEIDMILPALPSGLSESEVPIILYVGRMIASKNVEAFLKAMVYIRRQQPVFGILCGEGPQRSNLEVLSHKLGLDADIYFIGHLPAGLIFALMKKSSVFVSLSSYEGCPNTVMEAMACGCPLVLSDIPAHREILDESCALFVDSSNIKKTAGIILQALRNMDASKGRVLNAKQKIQKYSIAKMAENFEKVYREVISYYRH